MLNYAFKQLRIAFSFLLLCTLITGFIYPALVTGLSHWLFYDKANGSLITRGDVIIGSALIGQSFDSPGYFWGRPSATSPYPYNAASSSGSNAGPTNPDFLETVRNRILTLKKADMLNDQLIPVDLVTASGSGLDPHISPQAAIYQIPRVALARHALNEDIKKLVDRFIEKRTLHLLGEPRVNVLKLNIALDASTPHD